MRMKQTLLALALVATPSEVWIHQATAIDVTLTGSKGPLTVSGCANVANASIRDNVLNVFGLARGACALTVEGPGDEKIVVPVVVFGDLPG